MATTEDINTKILDLLLENRPLKVREINDMVGISKERMGHVQREILDMKKLLAQRVPRVVIPDSGF